MSALQYLIGLDIGSSSVKASLVNIDSGTSVKSAQSPKEEMAMIAQEAGWAEQDPELWWQHVKASVKECIKDIPAHAVKAIGISYQMHGLVLVNKNHEVIRPSIIWCDSRAVKYGDDAFRQLGEQYCLAHLLNSPGNFTSAKLKWVKENEPSMFDKIHKVMLPGDFIALKLTGETTTTATGLSEGIFWDYLEQNISQPLMQQMGFDSTLFPTVVDVFSEQGKLSSIAANELGLLPGIKISYRAGDQPNNAFSLNVLEPGETAATAGTSGVIYSVTDKNAFDEKSRVNGFIHVSNKKDQIRNGILLCVNGTGIMNSWLRKNISINSSGYDYDAINKLAAQAPIGSDGLNVFPFGNGAERIFENKNLGASFWGLNFNRHTQAHMFRAAQEGIVFALAYGFEILKSMGVKTEVIKAGSANMFLSELFREAFVNTTGVPLQLYNTDGATGAAIGAGVGAGVYSSFNDAFKGLKIKQELSPQQDKQQLYTEAYFKWKKQLTGLL